MRREYITGCAIGLLMLMSGCSETPAPPPDTSAADLKAIKDGEVAWAGDWASKDLDKIVGHYADDASVFLPDAPLAKGKEAIRAALKPVLADKNMSLSFTNSSADISKGGDLAYTTGTYSMTMTNSRTKKPETEVGKYVTVYRKQADGSFKAVADINNADGPARPVAVAKAKKAAPAARKKRKK